MIACSGTARIVSARLEDRHTVVWPPAGLRIVHGDQDAPTAGPGREPGWRPPPCASFRRAGARGCFMRDHADVVPQRSLGRTGELVPAGSTNRRQLEWDDVSGGRPPRAWGAPASTPAWPDSTGALFVARRRRRGAGMAASSGVREQGLSRVRRAAVRRRSRRPAVPTRPWRPRPAQATRPYPGYGPSAEAARDRRPARDSARPRGGR